MSFEGISINQLRVKNDFSNAESINFERSAKKNINNTVNELSKGQVVNPQKDGNSQSFQDFTSNKDENNKNPNNNVDEEIIDEEIIQFDLSDSDKYELQIDNVKNEILIFDKKTKQVIQKISAQELSKFVSTISRTKGSLVNKRF